MLYADLRTLDDVRRPQWLKRFGFSLNFYVRHQLRLRDFLLNLNTKFCGLGGRRGDMDRQGDRLLDLGLTTELSGGNRNLYLCNRIHSSSKEFRCKGLRLPNKRSWSGFLECRATS